MSFLIVSPTLPPTPARARVQIQTHFTHPSWPLLLLPKFPDMLSHSWLTLAPRWKAPCFISNLLSHLFILHWKLMWTLWPLEFAINFITINHECKYNCISQAWTSFKRLGKKNCSLNLLSNETSMDSGSIWCCLKIFCFLKSAHAAERDSSVNNSTISYRMY